MAHWTDSIPINTDQQILKSLRHGIAVLGQNKSWTHDGQTYDRSDLPDLIAAAEKFERRIAAAANRKKSRGSGIAPQRVRFSGRIH